MRKQVMEFHEQHQSAIDKINKLHSRIDTETIFEMQNRIDNAISNGLLERIQNPQNKSNPKNAERVSKVKQFNNLESKTNHEYVNQEIHDTIETVSKHNSYKNSFLTSRGILFEVLIGIVITDCLSVYLDNPEARIAATISLIIVLLFLSPKVTEKAISIVKNPYRLINYL
jgi:hypothetical protein